jgi:hypothetical protein
MPNLLVDISFLEKLAANIDRVVARLEESRRASQSAFDLDESDWQGHLRQVFEQEYAIVRDRSTLAVQLGQEVS